MVVILAKKEKNTILDIVKVFYYIYRRSLHYQWFVTVCFESLGVTSLSVR